MMDLCLLSIRKMAKWYKVFFITTMMPLCALGADYTAARSKALEAAYIQTGAKQFKTDFQNYFLRKGKRYATDLGVDKPLAVGFWVYENYQHPSYTFRLTYNKQLTINTNSCSLKIDIW